MRTGSRSFNPPTERRTPIFTRRVWTGTGSVEVAVFDKDLPSTDADEQGGKHQVFNVVAKRVWKEGEEYKSGNSFRPEDLLPLSLFLEEAFAFIATEQMKKK